jgi:hypothetical protein
MAATAASSSVPEAACYELSVNFLFPSDRDQRPRGRIPAQHSVVNGGAVVDVIAQLHSAIVGSSLFPRVFHGATAHLFQLPSHVDAAQSSDTSRGRVLLSSQPFSKQHDPKQGPLLLYYTTPEDASRSSSSNIFGEAPLHGKPVPLSSKVDEMAIKLRAQGRTYDLVHDAQDSTTPVPVAHDLSEAVKRGRISSFAFLFVGFRQAYWRALERTPIREEQAAAAAETHPVRLPSGNIFTMHYTLAARSTVLTWLDEGTVRTGSAVVHITSVQEVTAALQRCQGELAHRDRFPELVVVLRSCDLEKLPQPIERDDRLDRQLLDAAFAAVSIAASDSTSKLKRSGLYKQLMNEEFALDGVFKTGLRGLVVELANASLCATLVHPILNAPGKQLVSAVDAEEAQATSFAIEEEEDSLVQNAFYGGDPYHHIFTLANLLKVRRNAAFDLVSRFFAPCRNVKGCYRVGDTCRVACADKPACDRSS